MRTTREKILVGLVLLALPLCAFALLSPGGGGDEARPMDKARLQQLMEETRKVVRQGDLSPKDERRLALVLAKDPADFLYRMPPPRPLPQEDARREMRARLPLVYSGMIEAGGRRMAVLNGIEYEAGEPLEMQGYFLARFDGSKATVEQRGDGNRVLQRIDIPMEEDLIEHAPDDGTNK